MRKEDKGSLSQAPGSEQTRITPEQVQQVQEAIRRAELDMNDWREKSRVDPQKLKEPITR